MPPTVADAERRYIVDVRHAAWAVFIPRPCPAFRRPCSASRRARRNGRSTPRAHHRSRPDARCIRGRGRRDEGTTRDRGRLHNDRRLPPASPRSATISNGRASAGLAVRQGDPVPAHANPSSLARGKKGRTSFPRSFSFPFGGGVLAFLLKDLASRRRASRNQVKREIYATPLRVRCHATGYAGSADFDGASRPTAFCPSERQSS